MTDVTESPPVPAGEPSRANVRDLDLDELHDIGDRDELRQRYYTLLQELRVVLPGIQVVLGFLLTVPFTDRFESVDSTSRGLFLTALVGSALATICLMAPAVFHRIANRQSRVERLRWSIRLLRAGCASFAVAMLAAIQSVTRLSFDDVTAVIVTVAVASILVAVWLVVPLVIRHREPAS